MDKQEAIRIVRARYPRALVYEDEARRMAVFIADPIAPRSYRRGTPEGARDAWVTLARDIRAAEGLGGEPF